MNRSVFWAVIGVLVGLTISGIVVGGGVQRSQAVAQTTTSGGLSPSCAIATGGLSETAEGFFICIANLNGGSTQQVIAGYEQNYNGINSGSTTIIANTGSVIATTTLP